VMSYQPMPPPNPSRSRYPEQYTRFVLGLMNFDDQNR